MLAHAALAAGVWLLWKALRNYVVKGPLARVPGPPPRSRIFGHMLDIFATNGWGLHADIASYGAVSAVSSMFGDKWLYVYDPTALYSMLVKDQESWDESPWILDSYHIMLGPGLLSVKGGTHRKQRKMLAPVFSAKHLRDMTPVFYRVANNLVQAISSRVDDGSAQIDVLTWMGRTALELIGQAGIGYSFDPLVADVSDEYVDAVKNFLPHSSTPLVVAMRQLASAGRGLGSGWLQRKMFDLFPSAQVRRLAQIVDVLEAKSKEIFEAKKAAAREKGGVGEGKDIMSILLRANMEADEADKLPEDQLVAQMSTLLFAAMDTTSSALARVLHILSERPDVQERLRQELQEASRGADLDYDGLHSLPYLDAVCRETLRLSNADRVFGQQFFRYPPIGNAFREAMKDTVLPLSKPIRATDGTLLHAITIPRGTTAFVAVMACNRNKEVWGEDAEDWRPERWLEPLRPEVEEATIPGVYSHLMTFMGANRSCIGFKLSQLEMKLIISVLVQRFAFEKGEKPVVWNLSAVSYPSVSHESTKAELWLKVRRL